MNAHIQGYRISRHPLSGRTGRQEGAALFIALIVLVAMMLASIALVRSVDTANVIAGNLAFKQSTLQAADFGIEAAAAALPNVTVNPDISQLPGGQSFWYYSTRRDVDVNGVPITREAGDLASPALPIDWTVVPVTAVISGNTVKVVIDRLCRGPGTVDNLTNSCFYENAVTDGSKKVGATVFATPPTIFYRVTAQVSGPRNTLSMVQAIMGR
jgi:hypothetical protein